MYIKLVGTGNVFSRKISSINILKKNFCAMIQIHIRLGIIARFCKARFSIIGVTAAIGLSARPRPNDARVLTILNKSLLGHIVEDFRYNVLFGMF